MWVGSAERVQSLHCVFIGRSSVNSLLMVLCMSFVMWSSPSTIRWLVVFQFNTYARSHTFAFTTLIVLFLWRVCLMCARGETLCWRYLAVIIALYSSRSCVVREWRAYNQKTKQLFHRVPPRRCFWYSWRRIARDTHTPTLYLSLPRYFSVRIGCARRFIFRSVLFWHNARPARWMCQTIFVFFQFLYKIVFSSTEKNSRMLIDIVLLQFTKVICGVRPRIRSICGNSAKCYFLSSNINNNSSVPLFGTQIDIKTIKLKFAFAFPQTLTTKIFFSVLFWPTSLLAIVEN